MRTFAFFYAALAGFLLTSCSSKLSSTWQEPDYSGHSYGKILVIGMSKNLEGRKEFEGQMVDRLEKKGITAVEGISVFSPNELKNMDEAKISEILKVNGFDGVITMALAEERDMTRYEPGGVYNVPGGYYRAGRHIYRGYTTVYSSGEYVASKTYVIESKFFDLNANSDAEVWLGQSSVVDPSSIKSAAKEYAPQVVNSLLDEGIIIP